MIAATHCSPGDMYWISGLLQSSDSLYPTGSYAHSFGLEGLVQEGVVRDRETLRTFLLQATLPALRQTELPITAHAWHAFAVSDWNAIGELCVLSSALKTAREARMASENIGRSAPRLFTRARVPASGRGEQVALRCARRRSA
jgi:urease accessory protein